MNSFWKYCTTKLFEKNHEIVFCLPIHLKFIVLQERLIRTWEFKKKQDSYIFKIKFLTQILVHAALLGSCLYDNAECKMEERRSLDIGPTRTERGSSRAW